MKQIVSLNELDPMRFNDGYPQLLASIRNKFDDIVLNRNEPLFTTDAFGLYDLFLDNLSPEARQYYNCRTCRKFVEQYGGLVYIDMNNGSLHQALWDEKATPPFFRKAVSEICKRVQKSNVTGVFVPSGMHLGVEHTGSWNHMSVSLPANRVFYNELKTADQMFSEKREDFRILFDYAKRYSRKSLDTVRTAINYLDSGVLYRGEKFIPQAKWFLAVLQDFLGTRKWKNLVWRRAATAPAGWCHIGNSVLGALIDDIAEGYSFNEIKARFESKMDPAQYQRPQAAPAEGNIARAESIVAKLGIENSLKRRFARLDEIKTLWKPSSTEMKSPTGVFKNVKPKRSYCLDVQPIGKSVTMTWEKFRRKVLPSALKIEYFVKPQNESYGAIVTAQDLSAPPIIKWDSSNNRNPASWYVYVGGSSPLRWDLSTNGYVDVTGISLQPSMWDDESDVYGNGKSVFFILNGAKDTGYRSSGAALFPGVLKSDLREVRSTIEAYSKTAVLGGYDTASACGLRLQSNSRESWNALFRVTTDNGIAFYCLDRWD